MGEKRLGARPGERRTTFDWMVDGLDAHLTRMREQLNQLTEELREHGPNVVEQMERRVGSLLVDSEGVTELLLGMRKNLETHVADA